MSANFPGRLPDQEKPAGQQHEIAHGKCVPVDSRERFGQPHDRRRRGEERQAKHQGERQADETRRRAPTFLDTVRQQRDENEIVDAEHDLHGDQGRERRPGGGVGEEPRYIVHAPLRPGLNAIRARRSAGSPPYRMKRVVASRVALL